MSYTRSKKLGCIKNGRIYTKYNKLVTGKLWKQYRSGSNPCYIGGSNYFEHRYLVAPRRNKLYRGMY